MKDFGECPARDTPGECGAELGLGILTTLPQDGAAVNPHHIAQSLSRLFEPKTVIECRILVNKTRTVSGYYDNYELLERDVLARWDGRVQGVYYTLNPPLSDLFARSPNTLTDYAQNTTTDKEIARRRWLMVDTDPVRPAGISSTNAEHQAALDRVSTIQAWLLARGFPVGLSGDSGNGARLLIKIDLPNDTASTTLLQQCLSALALFFSNHPLQGWDSRLVVGRSPR